MLSGLLLPKFDEPIPVKRFELVDQHSRPVTAHSLQGRWLLVYFGFTHCPQVCPTELANITAALHKLEESHGPEMVTPVFISIDPVRDSPTRLKEYLARFHDRFLGLTGSSGAIERASNAFGAYYSREQPGANNAKPRINHSSVVYLVNPKGQILSRLPYGQSADARARVLQRFLKQQ
jgi:protein SCO1/2